MFVIKENAIPDLNTIQDRARNVHSLIPLSPPCWAGDQEHFSPTGGKELARQKRIRLLAKQQTEAPLYTKSLKTTSPTKKIICVM